MPKKKKEVVVKTSEDLYVDALTAWVEAKLRKEVWAEEDKKLKEMGKKLTGKDLIRQNAQRKYQLAQKVQSERDKLIKDYSEKIVQLRKIALEKEARDKEQHHVRIEQLRESCYEIQELERKHFEKEQGILDEDAWQSYIKCDGLPNPMRPGEMNTYLSLWEDTKEDATLKSTIQRTSDVLQLLDKCTDYMLSPLITKQQRNIYLEIENDIKVAQQNSLDRIVYKLLRDIDQNMDSKENIKIATFEHTDVYFSISLWVLVQLPIPMFDPRRKKREIEKMFFPEMLLGVEFPEELDVWAMCLRAMNVAYDHFSSLSTSYLSPQTPDLYRMNLMELANMEWSERLLIMEDLAKKRAEQPTVVMRPPLPFQKEVSLKDTLPKTVSEIYVDQEETMIEEMILPSLKTEVGKYELNLRQYRIVGGVYFIELLYQPPQPVEPVLRDMWFTTLLKPKWLQQVPFKTDIHPKKGGKEEEKDLDSMTSFHATRSEFSVAGISIKSKKSIKSKVKSKSSSTGSGSQKGSVKRRTSTTSAHSTRSKKSTRSKASSIAGSIKSIGSDDDDSFVLQDVAEKCCFIELTLPTTIFWIVEPGISQWDDDKKIWTIEYIFDTYFEKATSKLSFRTGKFGRFALTMPKYASMPYRHWEIGPYDETTVLFRLETQQLEMNIIIDSDNVCLQELIGAPNAALDQYIGQPLSLKQFKKILQQKGLDIFPDIDAALYVNGISEKPWPLEKHTYYNMALCCQYYYFCRSRWNCREMRRHIILNVKEWSRFDDIAHYDLVLVSPMKACVIMGEENSKEKKLDLTPVPKTKFCADLIHLIRSTQSGLIRNKMKKTPVDLINNVALLLCAIKPLSFS